MQKRHPKREWFAICTRLVGEVCTVGDSDSKSRFVFATLLVVGRECLDDLLRVLCIVTRKQVGISGQGTLGDLRAYGAWHKGF